MSGARPTVTRSRLASLVQRALAEREKLARRLVIGSALAEPPLALGARRRGAARAVFSGAGPSVASSATAADSGKAE